MVDEKTETLIKLGDALDATDEVQEENFIGFNKPDKAIWKMVRGNADAMLITLYKYQRQCRERFGDELCNKVEWKLPADHAAIVNAAKDLCRAKRREAKDANREARTREAVEAWAKRRAAWEGGPAKVLATVGPAGVRLDLIVEGGKRLERHRFDAYLAAMRKAGGRFDGKAWTAGLATDFEAMREALAAVEIALEGELPVLDEATLAHARADVRLEKIGDGHIGIFHPYSEQMNAAYRNAEETSGIIGWDAVRKCRVVGYGDADDLREVLAAIEKIHPEWKVSAAFGLEEYYLETELSKTMRRTPAPEILALLNEGITPLPHQVEGYRYISEFGGNVLVGDDMGLGKTFQVLLWAAQTNERLCVVCPKNVRRQWLLETAKFFKDGTFRCFEIDSKDTPTDINLAPYNIVSVNYEVVAKYANAITEAGFTTLVIDESHRIKNPKAKITGTLTGMADSFKYKILLSGTPIKNKKKEIFTQANLVRPGTFRSASELNCMTTFGAKEAIKTFFFRRTKKAELPNLPPKLRSIVRIEGTKLPDYVRGMEIGDISRLKSQLARGKVPNTVDFVEEILEGSDSKVIVFSDSDDAAQAIAEAFGEQAVLHIGATTHEKREAAKAAFMDEASEVRVFVATTGSCHEGVNLTIADKIVFNDLPWTPADLDQAEARAHRIGQKNECVNVYWICAQDNRFDRRAVEILFRKMEIYKKVIDGKKPTAEEQAFLDKPIARVSKRKEKSA